MEEVILIAMIKISTHKQFEEWFEKNYQILGYAEIIMKDRNICPDYVMMKNNKISRVELELYSSQFDHDINDVDEILCIKKDKEIENVTIFEVPGLELDIAKMEPYVHRKKPPLVQIILTRDEIMTLLQAPDRKIIEENSHRKIKTETLKHGLFRDKLLLRILYSTGIKVNELRDLKVEDIDIKNKKLIINSKGKRAFNRKIGLDVETCIMLQDYIKDRTNNDPLFLDIWKSLKRISTKKRLTARQIHRIVAEWSELALDKKINPECLRRTCAAHLHLGGWSSSKIKYLLGVTTLDHDIDIYSLMDSSVPIFKPLDKPIENLLEQPIPRCPHCQEQTIGEIRKYENKIILVCDKCNYILAGNVIINVESQV